MEWESMHWKVFIIGDRCHKFIKCSCLNWTIQKLHYGTEHKKGTRNYPSLIDLSMHSLQNRCRHSITVRVFRIIPTQLKTYSQQARFHLVHTIWSSRKEDNRQPELVYSSDYRDKSDTASPCVYLTDIPWYSCVKKTKPLRTFEIRHTGRCSKKSPSLPKTAEFKCCNLDQWRRIVHDLKVTTMTIAMIFT